MAQYQVMRCYHHCNCEDHPAVTRCSKCGKSLCRECADNLRSEETGQILCVDCLNKEMAEDVVWAEVKKNIIKKEMIFIILGFVIGLAIEIFLFAMAAQNSELSGLWGGLLIVSLIFFLPTLLASFRIIIKQVLRIRFGDSLIFRLISFIICFTYFLILCVASPIIFIWRLVKRSKDIKRLKRFGYLQFLKHQANEEYAELAAKMTTRLTTEEFERNMAIKYSTMLKNNKEEAEKLIAQERENYNEEVKKNEELEIALQVKAQEISNCKKEQEELQTALNEEKKKSQKNAKKARKESRSTDDVDDDIAA